MQRLRHGLAAWAENPQEPLAGDTDGTTDAAEGKPCHQEAFAKTTCVVGEAVWLAALDAWAPTGLAVRVRLAVGHVPVGLQLGGRAPGAYVSNDHRCCGPPLHGEPFVGQQYHRSELVSITWISLPLFERGCARGG